MPTTFERLEAEMFAAGLMVPPMSPLHMANLALEAIMPGEHNPITTRPRNIQIVRRFSGGLTTLARSGDILDTRICHLAGRLVGELALREAIAPDQPPFEWDLEGDRPALCINDDVVEPDFPDYAARVFDLTPSLQGLIVHSPAIHDGMYKADGLERDPLTGRFLRGVARGLELSKYRFVHSLQETEPGVYGLPSVVLATGPDDEAVRQDLTDASGVLRSGGLVVVNSPDRAMAEYAEGALTDLEVRVHNLGDTEADRWHIVLQKPAA